MQLPRTNASLEWGEKRGGEAKPVPGEHVEVLGQHLEERSGPHLATSSSPSSPNSTELSLPPALMAPELKPGSACRKWLGFSRASRWGGRELPCCFEKAGWQALFSLPSFLFFYSLWLSSTPNVSLWGFFI